jgi:hypothetical protein
LADAQARLSLRQALHEISGAVGDLAPELLTLDRETMALDTALCWIAAADQGGAVRHAARLLTIPR